MTSKKKDDAVPLSGCRNHVVRGRPFQLEGENRTWENTTAEIYKMVFGFGKMHVRLNDVRRNKKRQDQDQGRAENNAI